MKKFLLPPEVNQQGQENEVIEIEADDSEAEAPAPAVPATEGTDMVDDFDPTQIEIRNYHKRSAHPIDNIISDYRSGVQTRSNVRNFCAFNSFISLQEPKNIKEALNNADWIVAMQDELH